MHANVRRPDSEIQRQNEKYKAKTHASMCAHRNPTLQTFLSARNETSLVDCCSTNTQKQKAEIIMYKVVSFYISLLKLHLPNKFEKKNHLNSKSEDHASPPFILKVTVTMHLVNGSDLLFILHFC